MTPDVNGTYLT